MLPVYRYKQKTQKERPGFTAMRA